MADQEEISAQLQLLRDEIAQLQRNQQQVPQVQPSIGELLQSRWRAPALTDRAPAPDLMVNLVTLSWDKAGVLRDQYGHFCNEQGYILNEDGRYSFMKNYDAGRHQKPPQVSFYQSPPASPDKELEGMLRQMLEEQQRDAEYWRGIFEAQSSHDKELDIQVAQSDSGSFAPQRAPAPAVRAPASAVRAPAPENLPSCDSWSELNAPELELMTLPAELMYASQCSSPLHRSTQLEFLADDIDIDRPLLSHFRDCRESIEEIEVLLVEARHTPPLRKLNKSDTQVAPTAEAIKRPAGTLLGHGEVNPRKECQANAVELRSVRVLAPPTATTSQVKAKGKVVEQPAKEDDLAEDVVHKEAGSSSGTPPTAVLINLEKTPQRAPAHPTEHLLAQDAPAKIPEPQPERVYVPRVPYPVPPKKSRKDLEDAKCKEMLKGLEVKLPLVDTVQMVPSLKRYMKEPIAGKVVQEESVMMVSKECSTILQSKVLTKKGDPGRSTKLHVGIIKDLHVPDPPDPGPDPKPPEHNETKVVEMSTKEAATPGSCHKRKFHDITLHPPLKRIRADSGAAVIPTAAYVIDPGDTYGVYSRGPRPPPEQWYVLFKLPSTPDRTQSYPPRAQRDVVYLPDPEKTDLVYHMGPRPP